MQTCWAGIPEHTGKIPCKHLRRRVGGYQRSQPRQVRGQRALPPARRYAASKFEARCLSVSADFTRPFPICSRRGLPHRPQNDHPCPMLHVRTRVRVRARLLRARSVQLFSSVVCSDKLSSCSPLSALRLLRSRRNKWEKFLTLISQSYTEGAALDELGLTRYCCRRMLLTHVDLIEKLLNYSTTQRTVSN